ncbi:MAG: hypothetical protein ACTSP8_13480 [Promethearchaeota archaeon]
MNDLEKQLTDTRNELTRTQNSLKTTGESLETSMKELESAKAELGDIKPKLEQATTLIEEKTQSNAALSTEIEGLKGNLDSANAKVTELESTLESRKEELGVTISELSTELEASKSKIQGFENKVADLESTTSNSKEQTDKLTAEIQELNNKLSATQDENTNLNSQLMELNNILLQKDTKIQELTDNIDSKEKLVDAQTARLEEVETELGELKPPELGSGGFATEERTTCPMCGAVGHNIKQIEDKTKVLSYVGHIPMYAKKHVCKKCGYEF